MAKIIFNTDTDYEEVYDFTESMISDVAANDKCCGEAKQCETLCNVSMYMKAADLAKDSSNTGNYEDSVKAAYLYIYPFANRDYNP